MLDFIVGKLKEFINSLILREEIIRNQVDKICILIKI